MQITTWLSSAAKQLKEASFSSAQLDAEIILAHSLKKPRTFLHARPERELDDRTIEIANARLDLRLDHIPIAYIIGHKEFYGRLFHVSPQVLIPRPESEEVIELLREQLGETAALAGTETRKLVDIGTGSGALGITAKLLYPELDVTLLDISKSALFVAEKNIDSLDAKVSTLQSNLLESYPFAPDIVLANLPYVDHSWERSRETDHEPALALFADNDGLALIDQCLEELSHRAKSGCIVILEADPRQWQAITTIAQSYGFTMTAQKRFATEYRKD